MTSILVFILVFAGAAVIGWSVRRLLAALKNIEIPLAEAMILASGTVGYLGFWALYAGPVLGLILRAVFLALPVLLIAGSVFRIVRNAPSRAKVGLSSSGTELRSVTGGFLLGLGFLALLASFGNTTLSIDPNLLLSNDVRPGDNVLP
jgi:hypothetical protein